MSIVVNIISAVLKSAVGDKVGSGLFKELIGISLDGISEKGINEIASFINEEKVKIDSIFSRKKMRTLNISEENIDYVVAEIKHLLSRINITDEVIRQYGYNSESIRHFIWDEYVKSKGMPGNIECESEIRKCIVIVANTLIRMIYESEEFSRNILVQISNTVDNVNDQMKNISDYLEIYYGKLDNDSQAILEIVKTILEQVQKQNIQAVRKEHFSNNKKQDYIRNWEKRLFLHIDNEKNPITLAEAFIVPYYKMYKKIDRMGFFDYDTLDVIITKFMRYDKSSSMLITGVPGIGKSSIVSWISEKYKQEDVIVLRFRDWDREELEKGLLNSICSTLSCNKRDLNNSVLIIDGFDEIKRLDEKDNLLDTFMNDIKDFENFKIIITSRQAYISPDSFQIYLDILEFDIKQVETFYKLIKSKELSNKEKIKQNIKILGIPVILYMALMSGIDIKENPSKPELYNQIFAQEGGIFDKFSYEGTEYDIGNQILRHPNNIKIYLGFMQKAAFIMFEKKELCLIKDKDDYQVPKLEIDKKEISILEFPIKHLFDKTNVKIEFIHNSIYEYFVSEYIFTSIREAMDISKEKLASAFGRMLKSNVLSCEILEFLQYRILKETDNKFHVVYETFQMMIENGMTYYTGQCYKSAIDCEMNVFANMLEIIHLWNFKSIEFEKCVDDYIKCNINHALNLKNLKFENAKWERTNLVKSNLSGIFLSGANLKNAVLIEVKLQNAKLDNAVLENVDLTEADLTGADLKGANLRNAIFRNANLTGADLRGVILEGTDFSNANFTRANLQGLDLRKLNLR